MTASLGIDVGISAVRAAVMDPAGRVLASARVPHATSIADGITEQDPGDWTRGAIEAGRRAVGRIATTVGAIGVTALGPAPVLVDGAGEALARAPLFGLDRRADPWRARLGTGPDHALPTLLRWHEQEPDLLRSAKLALDAAGFVVRMLTGAETMDRITAESYRWTDLEPPLLIPEPSEAGTEAGGLVSEAASAMGLVAGTPVTVGTIDCFADVAAAGLRGPGHGAILLGSTQIVYAGASRSLEVPGLEATSHLGEGVLIGGSTATAGLALDRFAEFLGSPGELIRAAAALDPGSGDLIALPYLAGERTPLSDPGARGVLAGLTLATTRDQLYRAIVDGVAVTALDHTDRLAKAGVAPDRFRVAGGGVRNAAWLSATCDAVGRPLEVMPDPGAAVGAAWLGFSMIGQAPRRTPERTIGPDAARHARFLELLERSRSLWKAIATVIHGSGSS